MTIDEAVGIVNEKSLGRTRWPGQQDFLDEVLVKEIDRLREELEAMRKSNSLAIAELTEALAVKTVEVDGLQEQLIAVIDDLE